VTPEEAGIRLDQFLAGRLAWRSRSGLRDLFDEGRIDTGPRAARRSMRVREGDVIRIDIPPPPVAPDPGSIALHVIYEDEAIVALDKQAGVVVHPVGRHRYDTLLNALHHRYRHENPEHDIVPRLVHRIDQYTSGVLLVAKTDQARVHLGNQFEFRQVTKRYLALTEAAPAESSGELDAKLGPAKDSEIRIKQGVRPDVGLAARTRYEVIERYADGRALIQCEPRTGRTHQIRVHLASAGWPILCDHLYGDPRPICDATGATLLARFALHAERLRFKHPRTLEPMELTAPLPDDMQATRAWLSRRTT
jgi:23S rRNA pseudouridine1911/1915/1917 synthase